MDVCWIGILGMFKFLANWKNPNWFLIDYLMYFVDLLIIPRYYNGIKLYFNYI